MATASHEQPTYLAHHFDTPAQQFDAAKLGMWIFIVTEILMFGGLFVAYAVFKNHEPQVFVAAHHMLDKRLGALNTVVLLFSSLMAALAVRSAQTNNKGLTTAMLLATLGFAGGFLVIKFFEYSAKFEHGLLPGRHFTAHAVHPETNIFFGVYFMMTGVHGLHVVIGIGLILWVLLRANKGEFSSRYFAPVEGVGLYWHLVDLIWIYLFPLLYLVG